VGNGYDIDGKTIPVPAEKVGWRVGHGLDRGNDCAAARIIKLCEFKRAISLIYVCVIPPFPACNMRS
jgi:hypothetical protein